MVDRSAVGRRSKRKGKTYERRCASLLTEFTGVNFRSTPASGGFNKQGVTIRQELFCGDVICDRKDFLFCVEAKNRLSFSFESILKNPDTSPFTSWWYQCLDDAKSTKMLPILFFKPDNAADFVALTEDGIKQIEAENLPHFVIKYNSKLTVKHYDELIKDVELPIPYIYNWKDISKLNKEKFFYDLCVVL